MNVMTFIARRVSNLKSEQSELLVPYAVAVGDVETLVQHFTHYGQLQVLSCRLDSLHCFN